MKRLLIVFTVLISLLFGCTTEIALDEHKKESENDVEKSIEIEEKNEENSALGNGYIENLVNLSSTNIGSKNAIGGTIKIRWGNHQEKGFERIVLDCFETDFTESGYTSGETIDEPILVNVFFERYPYRLVIIWDGYMVYDDDFVSKFKESQLINSINRVTYLDAESYCISIVFNKAIEYKISELKKPGRIVIDIYEDKNSSEYPRIYSLRTSTSKDLITNGEFYGHIEESLLHDGSENVRILRTKSGKEIVEEGIYLKKGDAENRKELINDKIKKRLKDHNIVFIIEERSPSDIPQ